MLAVARRQGQWVNDKSRPATCQNVRSVLVAAPNLALDRVVRLAELRPGEVQRFRQSQVRAGGKGVNVCRAARLRAMQLG